MFLKMRGFQLKIMHFLDKNVGQKEDFPTIFRQPKI